MKPWVPTSHGGEGVPGEQMGMGGMGVLGVDEMGVGVLGANGMEVGFLGGKWGWG